MKARVQAHGQKLMGFSATLFLPHSLLRTRGVRALPTVDRAPFYNYFYMHGLDFYSFVIQG